MARVTSNGRTYEIASWRRDSGADLIFFIHGLGCSHKSFQAAFSEEALTRFSLVAIDLIGFGASDKPNDFSYDIEDHARICGALLEQLRFDRLHVVAHSMGGAIALLLSSNRLSSFCNIEGNLTAGDCVFSKKVRDVSLPEFESALLPRFKAAGWARHADLESISPVAFYRSARSLVEWSYSGKLLERFVQLPCRKSYFCGTKEPPEQTIRELARQTLQPPIYVPASGHFVMNENPAAFYSRLTTFLNGEV